MLENDHAFQYEEPSAPAEVSLSVLASAPNERKRPLQSDNILTKNPFVEPRVTTLAILYFIIR